MKKIALKDIAKKAGVSSALVSYVLNGKEEEMRIGKEIALKVRSIAKNLNYRPNQIAKSLKTNKTFTIGLIVANINYRFTTGVTKAIELEAKNNDFTVLFASSDESPEKLTELIHVLINRQVDGLIIVPVEGADETIRSLKSSKVPFVLIDRYFPGIKTNFIGIDNRKAAYKSVTHLLKQGKKRIGLVTYETTMAHLNKRTEGYMQALEESNIRTNKSWQKKVKGGEHLEEDVMVAVQALIKEKLDAIFFTTDTLAIFGLKKINAMHLKVPEDIAVVSFDESEAFDLFYCSITHGRQPLSDIGKMAVETLMDVMAGNATAKEVLLQADFVFGKSCGEN